MRRTTHLEPTNALPLGDFIPLGDRRDATGHLHHPHSYQRHPTQRRIARVDNEDVTGGSAAEEGLRVIVIIRLVQLKTRVLEEVRTIDAVGVLDDATHRSVPLVVAPGIEVALVDCASHKELHRVLQTLPTRIEHLVQGVTIVLEPKLVNSPDISGR
jgi:hypothetical protein